MMPRKSSLHPIDQSCLYNVASIAKLAIFLPASKPALEAIANSLDRYRCWDEKKANGGTRRIEAPDDTLKAIQKRIAILLQRIEVPNFLMAPVKGRSYVDNAATHIGSRAFRLLDIEDFFPSCSDKRVYWFFHKRMLCAPDVAALLTKLVTYRGHLPQGSPASPILAYFAYEDLWDEINEVVSKSGCKLSIYADDITISGEKIYEERIWLVKSCLHRFGFKYKESKERSIINKPADITGVIVKGSSLLVPNRQHQKLGQLIREARNPLNKTPKVRLQNMINGRRSQAEQISQHFSRKLQAAKA